MRNSTALGHEQVVHAGVLTKRSKYIGAWRVRHSAKKPGPVKYLAQCSCSQSPGLFLAILFDIVHTSTTVAAATRSRTIVTQTAKHHHDEEEDEEEEVGGRR